MSKHPVDIHAGARLRQRRLALSMTLSKLGATTGLTYQQVQKYERGTSRMGSSRLFQFAKALDVPVSYFFDDMPANARRAGSGRGRRTPLGDALSPFVDGKDPLADRETVELMRAYESIRDGRVRKLVYNLVRAVGTASHAKAVASRTRR